VVAHDFGPMSTSTGGGAASLGGMKLPPLPFWF
jgi:hypothetical protein